MSPLKPYDDWFLTLPIKAMERISGIPWNYASDTAFIYITNAYQWWRMKSTSDKISILEKEQKRFKKT